LAAGSWLSGVLWWLSERAFTAEIAEGLKDRGEELPKSEFVVLANCQLPIAEC